MNMRQKNKLFCMIKTRTGCLVFDVLCKNYFPNVKSNGSNLVDLCLSFRVPENVDNVSLIGSSFKINNISMNKNKEYIFPDPLLCLNNYSDIRLIGVKYFVVRCVMLFDSNLREQLARDPSGVWKLEKI